MTGARMAVDVGTVRIGVARSAAGTTIAVPVETVPAGPGAVRSVANLVVESAADVVYVGDPLRLDGTVGPAAEAARRFAGDLAAVLQDTNGRAGHAGSSVTVEVRMIDERLTTAQSGKQMRAAGRDTRNARNVLDQAAAVAILQNALERECATGQPAGASVEQD